MSIYVAIVFMFQQLKKLIATPLIEVVLLGNKVDLLKYNFDKLNDTN